MRTWIGDSDNLRKGDVITNWSMTDSGAVTLQVERIDVATVKLVLQRISELSTCPTLNKLTEIGREFGVDG